MARTSIFFHKLRDRWYRRGISRRHQVRRQLAYHVARRGFEIGDYTFGGPVVHYFKDDSALKIGKYCSLAVGSTFVLGGKHRTDHVTSFPLGRLKDDYHPEEKARMSGDIVLGSDVWVAAGVVILSGVRIGDGAVVGAGAVVIEDVPPYAVVFGNPARIVSKRFSEEIISELLELRWWDLPDEQVLALRPLLQSTEIERFIDACREVKGLPPRSLRAAPVQNTAEVVARSEALSPTADRGAAETLVRIIGAEHPSFRAEDMNVPFDRLGIDSFGMLVLRTRLEEAFGCTIQDRVWTSVLTPADILNALSAAAPPRSASATKQSGERRRYQLGMPQMALSGLSESWLFKEFGDIHWGMITQGLGSPSHKLQDETGERLYATFTRFRFTSTAPLTSFTENETLDVEARIARYGAGMFFSDFSGRGDRHSIAAQLMSSFSKVGPDGSNKSLLKGQPTVPADCPISALDALPEFARGYRERRAAQLPPAIFECEYDVVPGHDINGVGLLYFAAYPMINDVCATRHAGRSLATAFSTTHRDVFYFSNSDADETLVWRLHRWEGDDDRIAMEASLSRKSDGVLMAYVVTEKEPAESTSRATRSQEPPLTPRPFAAA
jgi:probable biosynthetic protein (TIGR04098 family)